MNLKRKLQDWLGYTEIMLAQRDLRMELGIYQSDIISLFHNEFSEKRKELSDRIGEIQTARLLDNEKARKHSMGEL